MKITTKKKAMEMSTNTLFKKGGTATKIMKYDRGKYQWTGSVKDYVGKEVDAVSNTLAIWMERRQDKNGPYAQAMCITH